MASKDPLDPADMRNVHISEARYSSPLLRSLKQYRLHLTVPPPSTVTGLRSPKSEYIKAIHDALIWKDPFGEEFTVMTQTPIDCRVTIDLLERRFGRSGRIVASCAFDLSTTDQDLSLDLKDGANNKSGELKICIASPLASTREAVQKASQAAEHLGPALAVVSDALQATTPLATAITTQSNAWQPLLSRLEALVKVADMLAEAHPWIKLAWGVVSAAYRIASTQSERDAKVTALVRTMANSCSFADEAEELKNRSKRDQEIINQILCQVMESAYFVRDYCGDESFIKRTLKNAVSLADQRIDAYMTTLEDLRRNLIDHVNIQCSVITYRVLDVVTEVRDIQVLNELNYTAQAHHDLDQGCLQGTRAEIIDAIVRWALGADTPPVDSSGAITLTSNDSSRVLWLCGTAGAGKSSILRSCAKRVSELERMGSYYGFDKNKPTADLASLFSTIARNLADLDDSRKQRLIDAVRKDTAIRRTDNCKLQFQHFIKKSFENDQALGQTIVFIDAFDESGDVMARANALAILTKRASELPAGIRVIVTSRYERDIQAALQSPLPPGVDITLVDDIPTYQTSRDIMTYMHNELRDVDEFQEAEYQTRLGALIRRAGTSFQWAATACRFICGDSNAGADPRDQIRTVLWADEGLYGLYSTVMKEHCDPSHEMEVKRVKSILGRIICAQEPLSLHALVHLVPPDSILTPDDMRTQRRIVKHLASLLSGTHSDHEPIVPLHSSYRDFLCNREHNKDFYIDQGEANQRMALACFHVMKQNLTFNICRIPTSFLRNVDIPELTGLREKHLTYHLSYACCFWASHVSTTPSSEFAEKDLESFFQKDFLYWLEVMSLIERSPQAALAPLTTSNMPPALTELQQDAMQFISMFRTAIMTSAPHIYLSGLTFAPTSSLLYQRWRGQFPRVGKLAEGQLQHWPNMMMILEGHHASVWSVAFSPNGKQIASGSDDQTIRLWNVETGASIGQPMEGHDDGISCIAFSPDGKQIASASWDKTIQLWSVETGASIGHPMEGHDGAIYCIAFSPEGKYIASGSGDRTIQLWSVEMGACIGQRMKGHHAAINSIAFSPDGKLIASGSEDKTIRLWNVDTGTSIGQPMEGHHDIIMSIAFSPDGKHIASGSWDKSIQLWNVETGASISQLIAQHDILAIAFSPDGKHIASASWDTTIELWNVEAGVRSGEPMKGHHHGVCSIAFSPDGKQIASGSEDKTIRLWNVDTGASIGQEMKGHHDAICCIAFSPDGKHIASGSLDNSIQCWNVEMGTRIDQPMEGHHDAIQCIAFSPNGKQIASGSVDKTIRLWNAETGAAIGQPMEGHHDDIRSIAFSPDGKLIASGSMDKTIQLWNVETGADIGQPMEGHHDDIRSIAFSPDGKLIASGSMDKSIRLWNVDTGASIGQPMEGHHGIIRSVAFSPDGKQIASGSQDMTIRLWNVETGASIGQPMEGHHDKIRSIAFSPNGKLIASGSEDKTIHLWNVETGASIGQSMEGHHGVITSIAFSPDGKQIASGSLDGSIRLWNAEMGVNLGQVKEGYNDGISSFSSHTPKHTLQYPAHLFPPPSHSFHLHDGWILGPSDGLILWVPAAYHPSLEHPNHHILGHATRIDFQHLKCGKEWVKCQEPVAEGADIGGFRNF